MLQSELSILALYGLFLMLTVIVQVLMALPRLGLPYLASARDDGLTVAGVAGRAGRSLDNSVVAMVLFAPAVLILATKGAFDGTTLLAAQIFLAARVLYLPIYLTGLPWLRTLAWTAGFVATLYLYVAAI